MFHVHSSNRVETLSRRLCQLLETPLDDPFEAEVILVQSHGLERWLSFQLAEALGIGANLQFRFPVPFLTELMEANTPGWEAQSSPFLDRSALVWALMEQLPVVATLPEADPLSRFLERPSATPEIRLYQLAQHLADLFDQYQIYRPHLLQRWLSGRILEEEAWQAQVWQKLIQRIGPRHRHALLDRFRRHVQSAPPGGLEGLPSRITVFGLSSLAPFFIEILEGLAAYTELHVFFLNPCQEYWGDILSRKQRARRSRRRKNAPPSQADQMELGLSAEPDFENELLAYFGKMGRDFFDLLIDTDAEQETLFHSPAPGTLLSALQTDVLNLREGLGEWSESEKDACPSLQVHSCHSALREVEVLNDILLDLFERDPDLRPRDVVVMAPRIEDYSSKIHAVFHRPRSDERHLPYDIADRTPRLSYALSSAFLSLLDLSETRWEISEVFAILEHRPIMRRFGLSEGTLEQLRHWFAASGIRWGRDAASKVPLDLPETHANTWRFGLDRLLLGTAMPGGDRKVFQEVLPYDHLEGGDLEIFSHFLEFWDQLNGLHARLEGAHPPAHWARLLRQMMGQFFDESECSERELTFLYDTLDEWESATQRADFREPLNLPVVRSVMEERFGEAHSAGGFLTGGLTFCNLLPMRSLPFRVVVLLGMGAREFPRQDRKLTFDLMRNHPQRGDRTRQHEDRYLFLEALLAARDHFIVLYTGQSQKDNSEMSPSGFVTQLQEYVQRVYGKAPETYHTAHRLQPFSSFYFRVDSPFRSFAREFLEDPPPLAASAESTAADSDATGSVDDRIVRIDDLIAFLRRPVGTYFQHAFDLHEPRSAEGFEDEEPVALEALERWQVDQWLLEMIEHGHSLSEMETLLTSSGKLPHGASGRAEIQALVRRVEAFDEARQPFLAAPALDPVAVDLEVGEWRVQGTLTHLREEGLRRARFAKLRTQDRYHLWVEHLVTQSMGSTSDHVSALLGRSGETFALDGFDSPHVALHELRQLVELRARALREPIPLFPRTSMVYVENRKRGKPPEECLERAEKEWQGTSFQAGEQDDYYHQLAFAQHPQPLDAAFCELSDKVLRPLLDSMTKFTLPAS